MHALILVDLQKDFFPNGALAIKNADAILPSINKLLELPFDLIIATKDWHPADHMSFAAMHNGKKIGEKIILNELEQILWPTHCVQNSPGAEFYGNWDTSKVKKIIYKGTDKTIDSYSTFFDNGHIKSTGLEHYLQNERVKQVFIAGVATDFCVKYSVLDALKLGFETFVITDACQAVELLPGDSSRAIEEMQKAGAKTIIVAEVPRFLQ